MCANFVFYNSDGSRYFAVLQILFLRSLFGLVLLGASTGFSGETISLKVTRPWLMAARTGINILGWVLFFTSLQYLQLATAVALFFSFPLFLAIISVPLLGEKVDIRRALAIIADCTLRVHGADLGGRARLPAVGRHCRQLRNSGSIPDHRQWRVHHPP